MITDNIVEILRYRKDSIYSGSFLWFDVFQESLVKILFQRKKIVL